MVERHRGVHCVLPPSHCLRRGSRRGAFLQSLSEQWEKFRPQKVSEEERKKAMTDMAKKVKGKVLELGTNHKTSRLIQAIIKQGTAAEKEIIWKEVRAAVSAPSLPCAARHMPATARREAGGGSFLRCPTRRRFCTCLRARTATSSCARF
jgi:hypothetical protein